MPKLIDLSLPLTTNVTVVPGHPTLSFHPIHTHETHGRSNTEMHASIHTGTHCDPPYHFVPGGKTIDQMPLERFMGPAVKIDLRRKVKPRTGITIEDVRTSPGFREQDLKEGSWCSTRAGTARCSVTPTTTSKIRSSPPSWRAGWYRSVSRPWHWTRPRTRCRGRGSRVPATSRCTDLPGQGHPVHRASGQPAQSPAAHVHADRLPHQDRRGRRGAVPRRGDGMTVGCPVAHGDHGR